MLGGLCLSLDGGEDVLPCLSDDSWSIGRWDRLHNVNERYRPLLRMMLDNKYICEVGPWIMKHI